MLDCLIIGGGPAGLTAATYLKRFHRDVLVVDAGASRARLIPRSHNIPGFPGGIGGTDMLDLLREQARLCEVDIRRDRIATIAREGDAFHLVGEAGDWRARNVILATGIVDRMPPLPAVREAIDAGIARLCPICDGYEATGRRMAIYAPSFEDGWDHAVFLRTFSASVTMAVIDAGDFDQAQIAAAGEAGIRLLSTRSGLSFGERSCTLGDADTLCEVDVLYIALGADAQSSLAAGVGAEIDDCGEIVVDAHMHTRVPGLYAVGDVTLGLNQVSVAVGQAAIAATAIHNALPGNPMRAMAG